MKTRWFKFVAWLLCFLMIFALLFLGLQRILTPKFPENGNECFYSLADGSVRDVVFIGPSQMFCTVDTVYLNEELGISSYDFGANSQLLPISFYYAQETFKHQSPKLVMVELCYVYHEKHSISDAAMAWNYAQMPVSREKFENVKALTDDTAKALEYAYAPLLVYHTRWNSFSFSDVSRLFGGRDSSDTYGFQGLDDTNSVVLKYAAPASGTEKLIPEENRQAILDIARFCEAHGARCVFFKAPAGEWTRDESAGVKCFMEENGIPFLELNDCVDEIGLDPDSDFSSGTHLNRQGARKTTEYLASLLPALLEDKR